jgi:acyl-CoA thioester hydrolase
LSVAFHKMDITIYYEDTDCGGVVYYANYLKYFDRARTHYLEDRGILVIDLLQAGTQFIVTHAEVHYRSPARYGNVLTIETYVADRSKASLTFSHTIRERTSRKIVVQGSATLAAVNLDGKLRRLPQPLLDMPEHPATSRSDTAVQSTAPPVPCDHSKQSG